MRQEGAKSTTSAMLPPHFLATSQICNRHIAFNRGSTLCLWRCDAKFYSTCHTRPLAGVISPWSECLPAIHPKKAMARNGANASILRGNHQPKVFDSQHTKKGASSVIYPQKSHQHGGLGPSRGKEGKKAKGTQHRQYDHVARLTLAQKRDFASSTE